MRKLLLLVVLCLMPHLAACSAEAPARKLIEVPHTNPVRTTMHEAVIWAYNRSTQHWNMVYVFTKGAPAPQHLFSVDQSTGQVKSVMMTDEFAEKYRPILHLPAYVNAPDGLVHLSVTGIHATYDWTYDPVTNTFSTPTKPIGRHLVGEMHFVTVGCDGNLYFGGGWNEADPAGDRSHNDAVCVVKRDMATGAYTEYGPIGPKQGVQEVRGIASDGTWIYVANGRMPYYLVAYDTRRAHEPGYTGDILFSTAPNVGFAGVMQMRYGAGCAISMNGEKRVAYWLYNGKAYLKSENPRAPWSNESEDPVGSWIPAPPKPKLDESGLEVTPPSTVGNVTLRYTDAAGNWTSASWTVPLSKINVGQVWPMSNGKLLVTCGAYNGGYVYDPATDTSDWRGITGGLSPYDAAETGGHTYICGYPNGCVFDYNESYPWTKSNPVLAFTVKDNLAPLQTDALMSCCTTASGRLYCVGQNRRAGASGVLTVYDPATKKVAALLDPFLNQQTDYIAAVPNGNTLAISSHRVYDQTGAKQKEESGCVTIYDASRTTDEFSTGAMQSCVVRKIVPVVGSKGAGAIQCVKGPNGQEYVVGWCAEPVRSADKGLSDSKTQSRMYRINIGTGAIEQSVLLDVPAPWDLKAQHYLNDWSLGPDGNIYTFIENRLIRVHPLDLTKREPVGTVTKGGRIAWSGGRMYLTGEADLREISGVLGESRADR